MILCFSFKNLNGLLVQHILSMNKTASYVSRNLVFWKSFYNHILCNVIKQLIYSYCESSFDLFATQLQHIHGLNLCMYMFKSYKS